MNNTLAKQLSEDLWNTAEDLRGQIEASEYKYIVLGLLFLRDANIQHDKHYLNFVNDNNYSEEDIEEKEDFIDFKFKNDMRSKGFVYVPENARWDNIRNSNTLRKTLDKAMECIEDENPDVENQLPKRYQQSRINEESLQKLINRFSDLGDTIDGGDSDYIGRVYEYFIKQFATESKGNGEFYTPEDVVKLLIKSINPSSGNIFDPCAGSGGIFVQTYKYAKENNNLNNLAFNFKGQELNHSTVKLAKMNMLLHNMKNSSVESGNSLTDNKYPDLKADYVITNPPFNYTWSDEKEKISDNDARFKYGLPSNSMANYAFIQHMLHHVREGGTVGTVISNGALSNQSPADIRKEIINDDLLDVVITLPENLFHSTTIPVSIFIFSKGKGEYNSTHRKRKGETLFIDATDMYKKVDRSEKRLEDKHIDLISSTIRKYRGDLDEEIDENDYKNVKDFCKVSTIEDISDRNYNLTPGRYIESNEDEKDDSSDATLNELRTEIVEKFEESNKIEENITDSLDSLISSNQNIDNLEEVLNDE